MYLFLLVLLSILINLPLAKKPLSEDDGNWYYLAVFWKNGVRLFKNYNFYGFLGVPSIAAGIYNLLNFRKASFFYYFKILWNTLTAITVYWLTYCFWHNHGMSFMAGATYSIITAIPNTLFMLTYAEHFFVLPINLSMIFTYYGVTTDNPIFFVLSGLMSAWAFQIKITTSVFCFILPFTFYFASDFLTAFSVYWLSFFLLSSIPLLFTRRYGKDACKKYVCGQIGGIVFLGRTLSNKIGIVFMNPYIDTFLRWLNWSKGGTAYILRHHNQSFKLQWLSIKQNMLPALKDLYLVIILALTQIIYLYISFDQFAIAVVMLLIVQLMIVYLQKNYYTPHFNPCWAPISILAAKTVWDMCPYLLNSGALGWAMIAFMGIESIKIGRIIVKSFSKSERNTFGFLGPVLGMLFRLCESIGEYIQKNSSENDKLFVWGDQPSIYLYAKREIFDTGYLFIYAHHGRNLREKELLASLRNKPPELLLFYNYKVNDGWNVNKLQETIGIPYNLLHKFNITDNQGRTLQNQSGIVFDFPLYRRDDEKYKEILVEKSLIARKAGNIDDSRKCLETVLEIFPEDYEASIQLRLLENSRDELEKTRGYLEQELSQNNDPAKLSILLRLLGDLNLVEGDSQSAIGQYEKALESNPKHYRVYNGLGELYFSNGNPEKAWQFFEKAYELNRYSVDVLNNIGVAMVSIGKIEDATKWFKKALSFMPAYPDAIKNLEALDFRQDPP